MPRLLSGSTWTSAADGDYLLVAELSGKSGTSVATYRETTGGLSAIDSLDLDPEHSVVSERITDGRGRLVREARRLYRTDGTFTDLEGINYGYDALGNLTSKTADTGRVLYSSHFIGFRKDWETDEQGITLTYAYDNYDRVSTVTRASATDGTYTIAATTTTYAYNAAGQLQSETISAAGTQETLVTSYTYDTAGRLVTRTAPGGFVTTTAYVNDSGTTNCRQITTTLPGGGTRTEIAFKDGRPKSVSGTAVPDSTTTYEYDSTSGNLKTTQTTAGQTAIVETDWLGRTVGVTTATWAGGTRVAGSTYNALGQLASQSTTAAGVAIAPTHLYEYDTYGRLYREALRTSGSGAIDPASDYDAKEYEFTYQTGAPGYTSGLYRYEGVKIWPHDGTYAGTARYAAQTYTQATGLASTTVAHSVALDFDRNKTDTTSTLDRTNAKLTVATTATGTTATLQQVSLNGLLVKSINAQGQTTLQTYDELGRLESSSDPRLSSPTTFLYHTGTTLVESMTASDDKMTGYGYDAAGRVNVQTNSDNKSARFQYDAAGHLTHQWGDTVNPVRYEYNELGQKTKMHTYRSGTWTGNTLPTGFTADGDVTTWNYQATTGLLTSKVDAANATTSYEYDSFGQVQKRTDGRGWVTNYEYDNPRKQLSKVDYTGTAAAVTTDVIYEYDRSGRPSSITDAAGTRSFSYYDTVAGDADSYLLNKSARLQSETLPAAYGSHTLTHTYQYGTAGRANGALAGLQLNTTTHQTYGYDDVLRLNSVTYAGGTPFVYTYVPNSNLIDTVTQGSGYQRDYDYETDSYRLEKLQNHWGTPGIASIETRLTYDILGRRNTEKTHGTNYQAVLNRSGEFGVHADYIYTDRSEVDSSAKYVLTGSWGVGDLQAPTSRDYTYDPIGNRTSDQTGTWTPNALNQYTAVPGFSGFSYDANGNLTGDGTRTYAYDAENRLISVTQGSTTWSYAYDYLGRRIQKSVSGGATTRFLYDGWNLIAELDGSGSILRRFAWGLDVSGTLQGAGGVGGLLVIDDGNVQRFPMYDASHNVIGLYDGTGATVAAYEYDPFGNQQTSAGTYAAANPFRSATKYTDSETGLVYYGQRYYSPALGRFINQDPIQEAGGLNLYAFCGNDGVNRYDLLGLDGGIIDWIKGIFGGGGSSNSEKKDNSGDSGKKDDSKNEDPTEYGIKDANGTVQPVTSKPVTFNYSRSDTEEIRRMDKVFNDYQNQQRVSDGPTTESHPDSLFAGKVGFFSDPDHPVDAATVKAAYDMWQNAKTVRLPNGKAPRGVNAMLLAESKGGVSILVNRVRNDAFIPTDFNASRLKVGSGGPLYFDPFNFTPHRDGTPSNPIDTLIGEAVHAAWSLIGQAAQVQSAEEVRAHSWENEFISARDPSAQQRIEYIDWVGNRYPLQRF